MKTRPFAWAVAIIALASLVGKASAEQLITLSSPSGGISQKITLNNQTSTVTGGPFSWNVTSVPPNVNLQVGSAVTTWCVELTQGIGSPTTYSLTSISSLPNATTIMNLFGEAYKNGVPSNAAAFQLALWELVFDNNAGSVSSGNFKYAGSSTSTKNAANDLLTAAKNATASGFDAFGEYLEGYSLYYLENKNKQNQVMLVPPPKIPEQPNSPVPAPPAALLAVFGVMALGGRAAWFRKKAPTA